MEDSSWLLSTAADGPMVVDLSLRVVSRLLLGPSESAQVRSLTGAYYFPRLN